MSINQYKILKKVGKGNFATVYKAADRETGRIVAVKIFSKKMSAVEESLATKEVTVLEQIDHQNIIRLFNQFKRNDTWYMIFEYCGKGDLQQLLTLNKGYLNEETVSLIAVYLVQALAELQRLNIAHRDIKLANILVNNEFEIKLADLGFAKVTQGHQIMESYAGTPLIMAPEIFAGGRYTNKCDIWSLGVVLYQMLFGRVPFLPNRGETIKELIALVQTKAIDFPKDIPISKEARQFISKCVEKNPQNRISAEAMKNHPWILKAKQSKLNLSEALSKIYLLNSGIFTVVKDDDDEKTDEYADKNMIKYELTRSLKRMLDQFVKNYQTNVDKFQRSYRELVKSISQKSNTRGLKQIEQILYKKILDIEEFQLAINEPEQNITIQINDFKHPKMAADYLRKFIPNAFKQESGNFERQLIRILMTIFKEDYDETSKEERSQTIRNLDTFLNSSFKLYTLDIKICFNLNPQIIQLANEYLRDIDKAGICNLFTQKSQQTSVPPLMDVLECQLETPLYTLENDVIYYLEALNTCVEENQK